MSTKSAKKPASNKKKASTKPRKRESSYPSFLIDDSPRRTTTKRKTSTVTKKKTTVKPRSAPKKPVAAKPKTTKPKAKPKAVRSSPMPDFISYDPGEGRKERKSKTEKSSKSKSSNKREKEKSKMFVNCSEYKTKKERDECKRKRKEEWKEFGMGVIDEGITEVLSPVILPALAVGGAYVGAKHVQRKVRDKRRTKDKTPKDGKEYAPNTESPSTGAETVQKRKRRGLFDTDDVREVRNAFKSLSETMRKGVKAITGGKDTSEGAKSVETPSTASELGKQRTVYDRTPKSRQPVDPLDDDYEATITDLSNDPIYEDCSKYATEEERNLCKHRKRKAVAERYPDVYSGE